MMDVGPDYDPCGGWASHFGSTYVTNGQGVRPFADGGPIGPEGFYLDLPNDLRDGGHNGDPNFGGDEPFYFRYAAKKYLGFYFLYGDSAIANPIESVLRHEGDWEFVWIRLNKKNIPNAVQYGYHGESCIMPFSQASKLGNHPRIFVGNHSHSNNPPGNVKRFDDDASGDGSVWTAVNLKNVNLESWYGYAGAWGEVHAPSLDLQAGPEGIDPFKGAPPKDADTC